MSTSRLTSDDVLAQEQELVLPSLSNEDGVALGLRLLTLAREGRLPVLIEVRRGRQVLFRAAMNGVVPDNDAWVAGKARTVERFGHASLWHHLRADETGIPFVERTGLSRKRYKSHGGGFPLVVEGTGLVGVVVVSGLPQREDHALVVTALRAHLAQPSEAPADEASRTSPLGSA